MKKTSLTRALLVAGAMAVAGIGAAQADAIFYPDGTSVDLGPTGADNLALSSGNGLMMPSDTTVLGAGPATTTTTTVTTEPMQYVYVQPNINWDPATARAQVRSNHRMMHRHAMTRTVVTSPVAVNSSDAVIVGSYSIPRGDMTSDPYYVFSY